MTEHDRDRRWLTTRLHDVTGSAGHRTGLAGSIFDLSADDAYADPGSPMMRLHPDGTRTVLQDGQAIYLRGDGAGPDGDRPFLDRLDLGDRADGPAVPQPADAYEQVLGFVGGRPGAAADLAREPRRSRRTCSSPAWTAPARRPVTAGRTRIRS